jgi:signal transduction histidine kinase
MNTILVVVIASSLVFQIFAAITALRLIRVTGNRVSWTLIALASVLQAVRRAVPLYHSIVEDTPAGVDLFNETIGLVLSILMVAGITTIGPFFTSIKRSEEALVRSNEQLERRVEERTKALKDIQERMVRQEKLAAIGKLAGSIGHELRNPMGVITNSVYFLSMKLHDPDEKITKVRMVMTVAEVAK